MSLLFGPRPLTCLEAAGIFESAMPTIDLTDDEQAALTAAVRRLIKEDRFPHAPRLDPLRSALAKLEAPQTPPPTQAPKQARATQRR